MSGSSVNFISLDQYKNHIYKGTEQALQLTLNDIKEHLLLVIEQDVYSGDATSPYSKSGMYERKFTLMQSYAWDVKYWGRQSGFITYELEFDDSFYTPHGVEVLNTVDDFIAVLDENVGELFTTTFHPEGWWSNFKIWVEANFDELFAKHLKELGIEVKYNI